MALDLITGPSLEPLTTSEVRRQLQLGSTSGEPAPTVPTVALGAAIVAGDCDDGDHRVGITFVTADGETEIGPLSDTVTIADKAVNGEIDVSAITLGGSSVTQRKVYLVPVAGGAAKLATTIANNTATTVTLDVADSALGAEAPTTNTTEDPQITRLIAAVRDRAELATGRALLQQTWQLDLDFFPHAIQIEIPKPPLTSVTSLIYNDSAGTLQTWAASNYVVTTPAGERAARGRLGLAFGAIWPSTRGEIGDVRLLFVCGYGTTRADVPALLKNAMLMDCGTFYSQREGIVITDRGAEVAEIPTGVGAIYRGFKSYPRQRAAA